jgi:hypothetical protein
MVNWRQASGAARAENTERLGYEMKCGGAASILHSNKWLSRHKYIVTSVKALFPTGLGFELAFATAESVNRG